MTSTPAWQIGVDIRIPSFRKKHPSASLKVGCSLAATSEANHAPNLIAIPLAVRLPIAAVLVVYAARSDRPWILAPAVALSLPLLWVHGLAVLVAITPLLRASRRAPSP